MEVVEKKNLGRKKKKKHMVVSHGKNKGGKFPGKEYKRGN